MVTARQILAPDNISIFFYKDLVLLSSFILLGLYFAKEALSVVYNAKYFIFFRIYRALLTFSLQLLRNRCILVPSSSASPRIVVDCYVFSKTFNTLSLTTEGRFRSSSS